MNLSAKSNFPKLEFCAIDELPKDGVWVVSTTDRKEEDKLLALQEHMESRLVVPEVWKEVLPKASLLISSAISGGSLKERFLSAAEQRSCYLLIEPMKAAFPLPFPHGKALPCTYVPEYSFFSKDLCCYYAHFPGSVVMWDTEESLHQKMQLAKDMGFLGYAVKQKELS